MAEMKNELPFQTWERITHTKWPGGKSKLIRFVLEQMSILYLPGSAEANIELQRRMNQYAEFFQV